MRRMSGLFARVKNTRYPVMRSRSYVGSEYRTKYRLDSCECPRSTPHSIGGTLDWPIDGKQACLG